jgi:hypothetical protein
MVESFQEEEMCRLDATMTTAAKRWDFSVSVEISLAISSHEKSAYDAARSSERTSWI